MKTINSSDHQATAIRVLAGDIGGTNTRLGFFNVIGNQVEIVHSETYQSQKYASLSAILQLFLDKYKIQTVAACFGIAGPVYNNTVQTTNLPWNIDAEELSKHFSIASVSLINDLEANAWGIQALQADDFLELYAGDMNNTRKHSSSGNAAVIAAGTGLGEAGMYFDGTHYRPYATEGGHTDFSPNNELEIELLRYLKKQYQHVSWERILAGSGLVNIHNFLREKQQIATPDWLYEAMQKGDPAAEISKAAQLNKDDICRQALKLFVQLYGSEAGNLALKHMATGGIYLGGGIAPKILDWLKHKDFINAFLDKGRMRTLLEKIPVRVILNDQTALYGPAVYAATFLGKKAQS